MSHLQLLSPATPHPASHHQDPTDSSLGSTPVSTGQVSRRFTRRVTPDPSREEAPEGAHMGKITYYDF
jgi:hypothetical protein